MLVNVNDIDSIFIITAPSGTGKTTLNRMMIKEFKTVEISVSLTTRAKRPNEVNGTHYWFVSPSEFKEQVEANKMLESAEIHGNYYGTSLDDIRRISENGHKTILEIDVQGWAQARKKIPHAVATFILPPSLHDLWNRLEARGTDSLKSRWRRLNAARNELDHCKLYQNFVINDHIESAFDNLKKIIIERTAPSLSLEEGLAHSRTLINEFEQARWLREIEEEVKRDKA